jgi:N-acetylneuraminic acid mutarotase
LVIVFLRFISLDTLIWRELSTSGHLLAPRAGHATVAFGKNLFVFGGFTDAQNLYNDLYVLDVGKYQNYHVFMSRQLFSLFLHDIVLQESLY